MRAPNQFSSDSRVLKFDQLKQQNIQINAVEIFGPDKSELEIHTALYNKLTGEAIFKLENSKIRAKEKILKYLQIVNPEIIDTIPEKFWDVYIFPATKAVAKVHYYQNGRAFAGIEIDNLSDDSFETAEHAITHEYMHLLGLLESGSIAEDIVENKFLIDTVKTKIGFQAINQHHYHIYGVKDQDWGAVIKIADEFDNGTRQNYPNKLSVEVDSLIKSFKFIYGNEWFKNELFKEFIVNLKQFLQSGSRKSQDPELVIANKMYYYNDGEHNYIMINNDQDPLHILFNEILNEFQARVARLDDVLNPNFEEIEKINKNGGYRNEDSIDSLLDLYLKIPNSKLRRYFIQRVYTFQRLGEVDLLLEFIHRNFYHYENGPILFHYLTSLSKGTEAFDIKELDRIGDTINRVFISDDKVLCIETSK